MDWINKPIILILCCLTMLLFVFLSPWVTQDGLNHKKVAVILSRLPDSPLENKIYQNNLSLISTNELFPALYLPVSKKISIDLYEKIFVAFFLCALIFSYYFFLKAWSPASLAYWPLVLPLTFHPLFLQGMYNFLASMVFCLWGLIILKKGLEKNASIFQWILFSLLSWLSYLAHPFPFFIFLPCLILLALEQKPFPWKKAIAYSLPVFFFFSVGFFISFFQAAKLETVSPYKFNTIPELFAALLMASVNGFSLIQLFTSFPFLILLLFLMWTSIREVSWTYKKYWILCLLIFMIFPNEGNQGARLNLRFLPYAWCFIPLGLNIKKLDKTVFFLSIFTWFSFLFFNWNGMQRTTASVHEAKEVYQALPQTSRVYPVNFDTKGAGLTIFPLMHLWAAYDDSKVVLTPYLFAYSRLMPLSRKLPASPTYFPSTREDLPKELKTNEFCAKYKNSLDTWSCENIDKDGFEKILQNASYYDYLFIYKPPVDFLDKIDRLKSYEKIKQSGNASLWKNINPKNFEPNPFANE